MMRTRRCPAGPITDAALRESSAKIVPTGAVLIAMYGATVGRTALLDVDASTNQAVCFVVPEPKLALGRYVWYSLRASYDDLLAKRVGGAQPNISQQIIRRLKIPLPPPSEQRRIVEILDQADALRKLRRDADVKAARILPALFLKMFGDPATNPMGWPVTTLGELADAGPEYGANAEHDRAPFTAIIASEAQSGKPFVIAADDAHTSKAFESTGQLRIRRTAEEIVECVGLLVRTARVVKLIDPHFNASKQRWRRGLQKLIEIVPSGTAIEIHRQDGGELESNQRGWFDGPVQRVPKNGVTVKVFLHPKHVMHNRYLLTDQGGASFGTGLDDHEDGDEGITDEDDVNLLTEAQRYAKWNKYASGERPFLELCETGQL